MKVYCTETNCPNKIKGYAICTALEDVKDCPKRKENESKYGKVLIAGQGRNRPCI